jgi:uncharacterized protein YhjY with autotransporter beta-barrel domain
MKRSLRATAVRSVSLLLALTAGLPQLVSTAYAQSVTLVTRLIGSNESPPTGSPGSGQALVVLNPALNTMSVAINFSGLQGNTTASHIHCCLSLPFQTGVNVGVATTTPTFPGFPLGVTAVTYLRSFDLLNAATYNPAFITSAGTVAGARNALVAGLVGAETYLNVHSTLFPGGEIRGFMTPTSGEAVTGAQQSAFQLTTEFLTLMLDPFAGGRGGIGGTGGAMAFAPHGALPPEIAAAYAAVLKAPPAKAPPLIEGRWTIWGGAYGGVNRTTGEPLVDGTSTLTARTGGFAVGADYRLSPDTVLGFALAGGATDWSIAQGLGGGRSDAFQVGVYGVTRFSPAYLAAAFGFTEHWMSTDRATAGLGSFAARFNAESYGGRLEGGYRFGLPFLGITPYAALQAQAFTLPAFTETDGVGGGLGIAFAGRTASQTRTEVGSRFDRAIALDPTRLLTLYGKVAWAHDWVSDPALAAAFQAFPGVSFIVNGVTPPSDLALVSVGAEMRYASGWSLSAKFDGEFADHTNTYAGSATVRYAW